MVNWPLLATVAGVEIGLALVPAVAPPVSGIPVVSVAVSIAVTVAATMASIVVRLGGGSEGHQAREEEAGKEKVFHNGMHRTQTEPPWGNSTD